MSKDTYPGRFWPLTWACALRFDGYRYGEQRAQEGGWFWDVAQRFIETNTLSADALENWLAFFLLQRRIGRATIIEADDERAFLTLFLHFYQEPTPVGFVKAEYHQQWERHRPQAEAVAQWARVELLHMSAA